MDATIIVVTNAHSWGRVSGPDATIAEALKSAASNAYMGTKTFEFIIYMIPEHWATEAYVNEMGGVCWTWTEAAMKLSDEDRDNLRETFRIAGFERKANGSIRLTKKA